MPHILHGDCLSLLPTLDDNSIDAIVTDPPYNLTSVQQRFGSETAKPVSARQHRNIARGFMGKTWDNDIAFHPRVWTECLRVLKPGGHMCAFGGTRTYHRLWCAIEDADFEIRDCLMWVYGTGFPKSHDVSKGIDKHLGVERAVVGSIITGTMYSQNGQLNSENGWLGGQTSVDVTAPATSQAAQWAGWGTALKPAYEPICLARKPLIGTVAETVLAHGTGGINVDASRVPTNGEPIPYFMNDGRQKFVQRGSQHAKQAGTRDIGRWPSNLLLDDSDEVTAMFPKTGRSPPIGSMGGGSSKHAVFGDYAGVPNANGYGDEGSAARFFPRLHYCAKASKRERAGSAHPTVKPIALLEWLCRLITPTNGTILDCFAGSGTTGQAALNCGFDYVLIEQDAEYVEDIKRRLTHSAFPQP